MSYYRPSFSQSLAMTRGRGFSPRGSSYRGSPRGGSSWGGGGRGTYSPRGGRSMSHSYDNRSKFSGDRFSSSRPSQDDYRRSGYRDNSYSGRDRSPDRKRIRTEAPSSRHEGGYGGGGGGYGGSNRYESSYSDRRSYSSNDRHGSLSRRDDFHRPMSRPPPSRGGYRGRLSSSRGGGRSRIMRERPRRRLIDTSYNVHKRIVPRTGDFARRLKISKMRSAIARRVVPKKDKKEAKEGEEDKEEKEDEEKEEGDDSKTEEKSPKKEKDKESESEGESGEEKKTLVRPRIKLMCPHCNLQAYTFRKYDMHLSSRTHLVMMRRIAIKQKSILAQMRQAQRNKQNELEKSSEDLQPRTNFCPLCKLNYKQRKSVHQSSEAHKNMKKFLMPYCKVCNITFKSPMIYESHCCSIEHIKRKQRVENGSDNSAEEDNLENFTTIDSVGDNDEVEEKIDEEKDEKEAIDVGIEQVHKVEAHYCDLCKMYLPRADETDMPKIISRHCKQRVHMQRYVRFKDLEKRAERLQRKETAEKEAKKKEGHKEGEEKKDAENGKIDKEEEEVDDKIWEDVEKDIGDIIAEAESGNKSSDEDEDDTHLNGERYDRFKLSEKNGDEAPKKEGEKPAEAVAEKVKVEAEEVK
ncbi:unnamed protein product [Brassicogethes aeneus]|uniref:U1-type domain-containing protein n=1 Tax=Brassicogethes aeneus TaxID=1431903 RepID=A0A9P0F9C8_BRAAE|nr:unnamed protein product [Brassicogethes aeneus]